jgi:hypothetical protein
VPATLAAATLAAAALIAVAACGSGRAVGGGDWSRVYPSSFDRVWKAAIRTLADGAYLVEDADPERGRIRAESKAVRDREEVVLDIRIVEREEDVRVDVLAGGGALGARSAGYGRLGKLVIDFLDQLDLMLGR